MNQKHYLSQLSLINFRNFSNLILEFASNYNLITGPNGSGKTNILESISMLAAGKGMRSVKMDEQVTYEEYNWQIDYHLHSFVGEVKLQQKHQLNTSKRQVTLNDQAITATELNRLINIFWLLPQQNSLFLEGSQERRKFFDRIVYYYDEEHASRIHRYEYYLKERLKVLDLPYEDLSWLEIIENKLAEAVVEIAEIRVKILNRLQKAIDGFDTPFPKVTLILENEVEQNFALNNNKNELITKAKERFKAARQSDQMQHRSHFGVHKTDFYATHALKNVPAKYCSTGEQQAILITIILALIIDHQDYTTKKSIILLDEVFVHLDEQKREFLTEFLLKLDHQVVITTTEISFCPLYGREAKIIDLSCN